MLVLCTCLTSLLACSHGLRTPQPKNLRASAVTVLASFDGASRPGYKDHPDTSGGIGLNHVADFVGSTFTVRDKSTGQVIQQMSQNASLRRVLDQARSF
jgi:hypothetical protein